MHCKLLNFIIHKTIIVYVASVTILLSAHEMKKSSHLLAPRVYEQENC